MSDISEIESALVALLTQIAYPTGTNNPSALLDKSGGARNVQLYRGWPVPEQLDTDMATGTVDVSVFPTKTELNATRYGLDFEELLPFPTPTLTLMVAATSEGATQLEDSGNLLLEDSGVFMLDGVGISLTVGGTVSIPQNVAAIVNRIGYSYGVQQGDTLTSIATGLAALINVNTLATSSGPVISIPTAYSVSPRIGVVGKAIQEVARQKRNVMITLWCPSPDLRDNAARLFDPALKSTQFLTMPDGTKCRLIYVSSPITDMLEKQACYRRDLIYSCEYGTTITIDAPTVTIEQINIGDALPAALLLEDETGSLQLEDGADLQTDMDIIETIYI